MRLGDYIARRGSRVRVLEREVREAKLVIRDVTERYKMTLAGKPVRDADEVIARAERWYA